MTALGIQGDGEKTVSHSDAASRWVDSEQLFTLQGDEEEVLKWGTREAANVRLRMTNYEKNIFYGTLVKDSLCLPEPVSVS